MKLPPETSPSILGTDRETPPGNPQNRYRETTTVKPLSENPGASENLPPPPKYAPV